MPANVASLVIEEAELLTRRIRKGKARLVEPIEVEDSEGSESDSDEEEAEEES